MEVSRYLREFSRNIMGKEQMLISAFARALEIIPRQLSDNAGFDSTDILNKLRERHAKGLLNFRSSLYHDLTFDKVSIRASPCAQCLE
jgi:chaperonin GroEL (HSP60 family)